jgi:hypothetical protein
LVLVVDDHVDTCGAMTKLIGDAGAEAQCVRGGADGLAVAAAAAAGSATESPT